ASKGRPAKGSVAMIVKGLRDGAPLKVFGDRTISPTYVCDAARATRELVEQRATPGLYHCVNSGRCTWAELAREVARFLGVEPHFDEVAVAEVPLRAARLKYCALSNRKLLGEGVHLVIWQVSM